MTAAPRIASLAACLCLALALVAPQAQAAESCIDVRRVTIFPPRGEIYVEIQPRCDEEDFEQDQDLLAYLEVLVGNLPAVNQEVRIRPDQPTRRQTIVFDGLALDPGDSVLVRLVRFGTILDLESLQVP